MGSSYFGLGDFENAIPLFKEAAEDAGARKLYDLQAHWLTDLAECYYAEHDYARSSEQILLEELKVARQLDEKTALTECLNDLAEVALETGRVDAAEEYSREELEVEKAGLDRSAVMDSRLVRGRIAAGKKQYGEAELLLTGIIAAPEATDALKWEAQARLAKLSTMKETPLPPKNSTVRRYGRSDSAEESGAVAKNYNSAFSQAIWNSIKIT